MAGQCFSRRRFLAMSGVALSAGVSLSCTRTLRLCASDLLAPSRPIFRFWQWNDVHVQASPSAYELANEKLQYLVRLAHDGSRDQAPDFVLGIGDMIHGATPACRGEDYIRLKGILKDLPCPYYPVMGNHESMQTEADPLCIREFQREFGQHALNYVFKRGGFVFIMLDDSGAPMLNRMEAGRRRNRWLADTLQQYADQPKILCCHIPLIPIREDPVLQKSFGFISHTAQDEELLGLIEDHADSILAVLSGHLHLSGVVRRQGIYHIVPSGTASYPCDYAIYEVYSERIHVRLESLPPDLRTLKTNLHGRPRHPVDYTDSAHPTPDMYIKGTSSEREFDIPLRNWSKFMTRL